MSQMKNLQEKLQQRLKERESEIIELRRHMHQYPELSFKEEKTAKFIADYYEGKDCLIKTNVGDGYGITVDIQGGLPGANLAIRADFDALPIQEDTNLPFASQNPGVMHACGHDGHTAYMMVLADTLIELKDELPGMIRVLHQPAEEIPPGGAIGMIEAGCLDGIDHVLGAHVMTNLTLGKIGYREGAIQTGRSTFKLKLQGKGGHGAAPHEANDTIVAAAHFITAVQTIVSRRINPADTVTVTIGSFDGAGIPNIIKDSVSLSGDVRVMRESNLAVVEAQFKQILDGICQAFGVTYDLDYSSDYPVLMNDTALTEMTAKAFKEANIENVTDIFRCEPQTPSEDFAYYAKVKPSSFFYIGATKEGEEMFPHHHPKFQIDEECLLIAARAMGSAVLEYQFNGVK